jgi:hypothetical protein
MDYFWYKEINNSDELSQGDLIPNCPIVIPPTIIEVDGNTEIEIQELDTIVLSQSCDLANSKIDIVLVCPYYTLKEFLSGLPDDQQSKKAKDKTIDNLRKGHLPSYHLLNKSGTFDSLNDYIVVDFKNVYGIHINALKTLILPIEKRYRLLPPYREHLSQSFARYFMRVGLPQDIKVDGY